MNAIKPVFLILFLITGAVTSAQVIINEYSASNLEKFADNYGKFEDWIELYNTTSSTVDIGGMYLSDRPSKSTKWMIPAGTTMPPGGLLKFWCSGKNEVQWQDYHTNFKLTQTKGRDSVVLSSPTGNIMDAHPMEITLMGHSRCRVTDGSASWQICSDPSPGNSNNGTPQYTRYADQPDMSLPAGFYNGSQTVSISTTEPNATLYYTTDGTAPSSSSTAYAGQITITTTTLLKAIVISNDPGVLPGKITSNTYFIDESISLAVISVGADELFDLANGNSSLEPIGSIEYFDQTGTRVAASYGELNKHGQDSWALPHRSIDWISRDEMGHNHAILAKLFHYSDRDEYQRIIMRASGDDNYPAVSNNAHEGSCHVRDEYVHVLALEGGMDVDVRAVERIVVFLNGQYWGVYGLRERPVDHDYTNEYYDQSKLEIQYLSTWGNTVAEYGGSQAFTDWADLRDFILNNDMSNPINYQVAKDNIRLTSLIDYMIANLNSVASDWLNYNTGWWRGLNPQGEHQKWGYILWDNDATFDYYINYSGVPNTDPDAEPCDIDDIAGYMDVFFGGSNVDVGRHEKIFLKLQDENPEFQQLYYSRQADLMNTVYTCDNMLNTLDSMINTIEPEMPRQISRWGGSFSEWWQNVGTLRNFVEQRCTLLADGMINCFNLTGPYSLTLMTDPPGAGTIELNTLSLTNLPWTGEYFGNMDNLVKANPEGNYAFVGWESKAGHIISPHVDSADASLQLTQGDTLVARFETVVDISYPEAGFSFSAYPTILSNELNVFYSLDKAMEVEMGLYSLFGVRINELEGYYGHQPAGEHYQQLDLRTINLAPGIYLFRFKAGDHERTTKVLVQ